MSLRQKKACGTIAVHHPAAVGIVLLFSMSHGNHCYYIAYDEQGGVHQIYEGVQPGG